MSWYAKTRRLAVVATSATAPKEAYGTFPYDREVTGSIPESEH